MLRRVSVNGIQKKIQRDRKGDEPARHFDRSSLGGHFISSAYQLGVVLLAKGFGQKSLAYCKGYDAERVP
jgi:hypothetical protein